MVAIARVRASANPIRVDTLRPQLHPAWKACEVLHHLPSGRSINLRVAVVQDEGIVPERHKTRFIHNFCLSYCHCAVIVTVESVVRLMDLSVLGPLE
jgi:hypothetical protein